MYISLLCVHLLLKYHLQLTSNEHSFLSQYGNSSLKNFIEINRDMSTNDAVLSEARHQIKNTIRE